jgi:DNA-binding phage protein
MAEFRSKFWDHLEEDLKDPAFARGFYSFGVQIKLIDQLLNELDEKRVELGVSKSELARALGVQPSNMRRLLGKGPKNPTLSTLVEIAFALGFKVTLEPLQAEDTETVMPAREGSQKDTSRQQ